MFQVSELSVNITVGGYSIHKEKDAPVSNGCIGVMFNGKLAQICCNALNDNEKDLSPCDDISSYGKQYPARIVLLGRAGAGKDTVGDILQNRHGFRRYAFADKLKEIARDLFPDRFQNGEKPRRLLQDLGMSMRSLDPECWVNVLMGKIREERPARAVITDCRLSNELEAAMAEGFIPVRVVCPDELRLKRLAQRDGQAPDIKDMEHVSEISLDQASIKNVIHNCEDIETLVYTIDHLIVAL